MFIADIVSGGRRKSAAFSSECHGRIETAETVAGNGRDRQLVLLCEGARIDKCAADTDGRTGCNVPPIVLFAVNTRPSYISGQCASRQSPFPTVALPDERGSSESGGKQ